MERIVMGKQRDSDTGQYTPSHSDEDLLAYLNAAGPTSTQAVADQFEYQQPTAYRRLRQLEQEGKVTSERVGNALLWSIDEG